MKIITTILALTIFTTIGHAQILSIQCANTHYTGIGASGGGTHWDPFTGSSGSSLTNLQTSTGAPSTVNLTISYANSQFGGPSQDGSTDDFLLGAGFYGPTSFTFSGLSLSSTYSLYIYVGNKANTATSLTISTPGGFTLTPSPVNNQTNFVQNNNFVVFSGLQPNASGQIIGSESGSFSALNGLQLQVVPEPSCLLLLLVSGVMVYALTRLTARPSECAMAVSGPALTSPSLVAGLSPLGDLERLFLNEARSPLFFEHDSRTAS